MIQTGDPKSVAKRNFVETFVNNVLVPRNLNHKLLFTDPATGAALVSSWALERGLIVEPARHRDDVALVLPPITISEEKLREGLHILRETVALLFSQK